MKNKLFIATLASTLIVPSVVAPVQAYVKDPNVSDFYDVKATHWAYEEINEMRSKGVISGYPTTNTFEPSANISRMHVAVLFVRSLDLPIVRDAVEFKDVPKSHMYYEEIQRVYQAGIFDGVTSDTFNPEGQLTRAQMSKILNVAFNLKSSNSNPFPDILSSHWANEHVSALYTSGITTGSNGLYKPNDRVSRAHYAVFLSRALKTLPEDTKPIVPPIKEEEPKAPEVPKEPELPPVIDPEEGLPQPPLAVSEALNKMRQDHADLFIEDGPFLMASFYQNPISAKLYLEGTDAVRKTNLKFDRSWSDTYRSSIRLKSPGYDHPTKPGDLEIGFSGTGEREGQFAYDFRSDNANFLAKEWLVLLNPEFKFLLPVIDKKVSEARIGEQNKNFKSNFERFEVGDYRLRLGVDSFYEWMWIEIEL